MGASFSGFRFTGVGGVAAQCRAGCRTWGYTLAVFVGAGLWGCGGNSGQRSSSSELPARCSSAESLTCIANVEDEAGELLLWTQDNGCDGQSELTRSITLEDQGAVVRIEAADGEQDCEESQYDDEGNLVRFVQDAGCDGSPVR